MATYTLLLCLLCFMNALEMCLSHPVCSMVDSHLQSCVFGSWPCVGLHLPYFEDQMSPQCDTNLLSIIFQVPTL